MTRFVRARPVQTRRSSVVVDGGLRPGRYRFQLEVMDSAGNLSKPAILTVSVQAPRLPTATRRAPARPRNPRAPR